MLRRLVLLSGVGLLGATAYKVYSGATSNTIDIAFTETIDLPPESTDSFTDIGAPIAGECRITTNLLATYCFSLKLNSSSGMASSTASGSFGTPAARAGERPEITDVVIDDFANVEKFNATGLIDFIPARVSQDVVLFKYRSHPSMSFVQPCSIKNCVVQPASTPGAFRVAFQLFVNTSAMDVKLTMIFPKGAAVINVEHDGVGRWRAMGPNAPSEIEWDAGTFVAPRQPAHTTDGPGSPMREGSPRLDESTANLQPMPSFGEAGQHLKVIPFEATYTVDIPDDVDDGAGKSRQKKRKAREDLRSSLVPGICIAYASNSSASGLAVRKMQTLDGKEGASWLPFASKKSPAPDASGADAVPVALGVAKPVKRVRYLVQYVQQVHAELVM